jgi:hypothetical protein
VRELIGRLEVVDDESASALRVIDHFDRLVDEKATRAAVVRAVAAMAACPAGMHDAARELAQRFTPSGRPLTGEVSNAWRHMSIPGHPGSRVWLERIGADGPLDTLILERASRALQALTEDSGHRSTSGLVSIVCDPGASTEERRNAVTRIGLAGAVTVVLSTSSNLHAPLCATLGAGGVVALLPGRPDVPEGISAGAAVAPDPLQLPTALEQARVALRLANDVGGRAPSVVRYEDLGALANVVERFTRAEAAAVDDVRALHHLLAGHPWVIETLQAVLDQPSLRQSAVMLHLHHSTLQERLKWLTTQLGYSPAKARGRQRAAVAVLLWQVAHGGDEHSAARKHARRLVTQPLDSGLSSRVLGE